MVRHRCDEATRQQLDGVSGTPLSGLGQRRGRDRQAIGGHVARNRCPWAAASGILISVGADFYSRLRTVVCAATALSAAPHGSRNDRKEGIGKQHQHHRQADNPRQDDWALMQPNGTHGRHHKIGATMCQSKNAMFYGIVIIYSASFPAAARSSSPIGSSR